MKINRRNFILKLFFGIAGLVVVDAFWFEKYIIDWNEFDLSNGERNKIKVVQLSDLHLISIKSFHKSIAERINEERPDAVLLTGDAITRKGHLPLLESFLSLMDPAILKIAILGNKEYSGRIDLMQLKHSYENHNGVLLINETFVLNSRHRKINVVSVDDYVYGKPDFSKSVEGLDASLDSIILSHCPIYKKEIDRLLPELRIKSKLILAGHTHGGQITFFGKPLYTPYGSGSYVRGWYENDISKMYVSKGVGTTVLPIRFGARAEVTIFYV